MFSPEVLSQSAKQTLEWYHFCVAAGIPSTLLGFTWLFRRNKELDQRQQRIMTMETARLYRFLRRYKAAFAVVFQQRHRYINHFNTLWRVNSKIQETDPLPSELFSTDPKKVWYAYYGSEYPGPYGQFFSIHPRPEYRNGDKLTLTTRDPYDARTRTHMNLPLIPLNQAWPVDISLYRNGSRSQWESSYFKNSSSNSIYFGNFEGGKNLQLFTAGIDPWGIVYYGIIPPHEAQSNYSVPGFIQKFYSYPSNQSSAQSLK